jgi:Uri superfamily endonuclease
MGIGKRGNYPVPRGWYIYVGSAFGPGGLRARCRRHLRRQRRRHWHIDYLRAAVSLKDIWFTADSMPREHHWAAIIAGLAGARAPIPRFGSSDCLCSSHLFHFSSKPSLALLRLLLPARGSIMAFSPTAPRQARRNVL